jgi:bifunctional DNA-binding transcriptional regulator/antitoxin component of YhaV-PrlF toxin-antitoxin module
MELQTKAKIKAWGNSLGIVIPKEIVIKENLEENEEVEVIIRKKRSLKDLFGKGKGIKIDSQKMKDESRKIWDL